MKSIVFIIVALLIVCLDQKEIRFNSLSTQNLIIDSFFVKDIESAAGLTYNSVIIANDTIVITQDIDIHGISLTIICNKLISAGKKITIFPNRINELEHDRERNGLNGVLVRIYTRSAVDGTFILLGGNGYKGEDGDEGGSGSSEFPGKTMGVHKGTPGKNGEDGGKGGMGGHLTIFTTQNGSTVTLESKGGEGGPLGKGGDGGYTYDKRPRFPQNEPVKATIVKTRERKGNDGTEGVDGARGNISVAKVEESSLLAQIKAYGFTNFKFDSTAFTVRFLKRVSGNRFQFGPKAHKDQRQKVN